MVEVVAVATGKETSPATVRKWLGCLGTAKLAVVRRGNKAWGAQDPSPTVMEDVCHPSNAARGRRCNFFKLGIGVEEDHPTKGVSESVAVLWLCRVSIF